MHVVEVIFYLVIFYLLIGLIFAGWFVTRGVKRIDANAQEGSLGFRLLIFPGSAALWPLLMMKSKRKASSQ